MREYHDFFPRAGLLPDLTPQQIERFVALDENAGRRLRAGDIEGAAATYRAQIAIFAGNPEPHLSLAFLEAARGSKTAAVEHLRAAVVRGHTDLLAVERAEAWDRMQGYPDFLALQDAVPALLEIEDRWPGWNAFRAKRALADLDAILDRRTRVLARVDELAPVLGPRLTGRWHRLVDRVTASLLEAYVAGKPDAEDAPAALDRLLALYAGETMLRWQVLPNDAAARLATVSVQALERFPDDSRRAVALVGAALARNVERDKKGDLQPPAADAIRISLEEVLERYPDSDVAASAAVGLVRTDIDLGEADRAAARYRSIAATYAADPDVMGRIRQDLGELALRLGGVPEFRAATLEGETVGRDALLGKVAVIDFWATWCGPCVDEFPTFRKIRDRYGDDVLLLGVNLDTADDYEVDELRRWVADRDVPGSHVHDGEGWESELVTTFGVDEIPFTVVVGPDGDVLAVNEHGKKLEKAVKAAVRSGSASASSSRTASSGGSAP